MISTRFRLLFLLASVLAALFVPLSPAQEAGQNTPPVDPNPDEVNPDAATVEESSEAAAAADETAGTDDDSILSLVIDSGVTGLLFMGALGLFSLISVTVAMERLVTTRQGAVVPQEFIAGVQQVCRSQQSTPEDLKPVCERDDSPAAKILAAGVERSGRPLPEVEKAMEDVAAREMSALRSKVRPLSVTGSVAPLLGLLGTVVGMIIAFRTASQSGLGKGELLAQGIYMALITTAAGLTIAIPSLLAAAFFNGRIERYFRTIDETIAATFGCFARVEQAAAASPPPAPQNFIAQPTTVPEASAPETPREKNRMYRAK